MNGPINVKSPNNISEWKMGFNSAFKGLMSSHFMCCFRVVYMGNVYKQRGLLYVFCTFSSCYTVRCVYHLAM